MTSYKQEKNYHTSSTNCATLSEQSSSDSPSRNDASTPAQYPSAKSILSYLLVKPIHRKTSQSKIQSKTFRVPSPTSNPSSKTTTTVLLNKKNIHQLQQTRSFTTSLSPRKNGVENDPLLKLLDFAKQDSRLKEEGFKKTKDGRFYAKTFIDPELMTEEERKQVESGSLDDVDEESFDAWLKQMDKEERRAQKESDEAFIHSDISSSIKSYSFSELLDEAEQYLLNGKPIPHFNTLSSHIPYGQKEDIYKRPDYSHFKNEPPTMKDIRQTIRFHEQIVEDEKEQNAKQKQPNKPTNFAKNERSMYYQDPNKVKQQEESESEQTEVETIEDYERIKIPEDAYSAYFYFRNEVYLRRLDAPKTREEEEDEIADFFIESYSEDGSPAHYLDDPTVKDYLVKQYGKFDKMLDKLTMKDMPTPVSIMTQALDIRSSLETKSDVIKKEKREKKHEQVLDYIGQVNRTIHLKGQIEYKFDFNPKTKRIERRRVEVLETQVKEPVKKQDLQQEVVEEERKTKKEEVEEDEDSEMMKQYFEDVEQEESSKKYVAEPNTEEILLRRLMKMVNAEKDDIENFTESELMSLQELVEKNKNKFSELAKRQRSKSTKPIAPTEEMFLPDDDEIESTIRREFGCSVTELQEVLKKNPQLAKMLKSLQHDADFAFGAFKEFVVQSGGVQKLEEKLNDKSKVNRSFTEWLKYKRNNHPHKDSSLADLTKKLQEAFNKSQK